MRNSFFETGELVVAQGFVSVWVDDLSNACDSMKGSEVGIVLAVDDDFGWIKILSPRGVVGLIHQTNLKKIL